MELFHQRVQVPHNFFSMASKLRCKTSDNGARDLGPPLRNQILVKANVTHLQKCNKTTGIYHQKGVFVCQRALWRFFFFLPLFCFSSISNIPETSLQFFTPETVLASHLMTSAIFLCSKKYFLSHDKCLK